MNQLLFLRKLKHPVIFLLILSTVFSCNKGIQERKTVYFNDFQDNDLRDISGGIISPYNSSMVLGRYNNDGFELRLNQLPAHDLIEVSFDLFVHDSWDGNGKAPDGPDIWKLEIEGSNFINTTFSNNECAINTCIPQSYPFNYLNNNQNPKTGANLTELPGVCLWPGRLRGTTMYKIIKKIRHSTSTFSMRCIDELQQSNTALPICDESWSLDNLEIKTVKID